MVMLLAVADAQADVGIDAIEDPCLPFRIALLVRCAIVSRGLDLACW
jgi:hypothetical protein